MNADPTPQDEEGEASTPEGVLLPPRDKTGMPGRPGEKALTEEGREADETELAAGRSVDERGQPVSVRPPASPSESQV